MIGQATIDEFYQALRRRWPDAILSRDQAEDVLRGLVGAGDSLARIAKANDWTAEEVNNSISAYARYLL